MAYIVKDLPAFLTQTSSGGSAFSQGVGALDDASNISIMMTSSALSTVTGIQVSQFDPMTSADPGTSQSTGWYFLSTSLATFTSSASQIAINNIAFRGLRLVITATSSGKGEIMGYVMKQITV